MIRFVRWLARHAGTSASIAAVYSVAVTLGHEVGQAAAGWLMKVLTTERLTMMITAGGLIGTAVLAGRVRTEIIDRPFQRTIAVYGVLTVILAIAGYNALFAINTEAIHYPQYALLAMVILPVVPRYGETVLLVTLLGAVDEAYHYLVLNAAWEFGYLDFNDIVLNLIGAAIGVVLVAAFLRPAAVPHPRARYRWLDFVRSPAFLMAAAVTVVGLALYAIGKITIYADPAAWAFLRKSPVEGFWFVSYWGKTSHVLLPGEGLVLTWLLVLPYVEMDRRLPLDLRGA